MLQVHGPPICWPELARQRLRTFRQLFKTYLNGPASQNGLLFVQSFVVFLSINLRDLMENSLNEVYSYRSLDVSESFVAAVISSVHNLLDVSSTVMTVGVLFALSIF